MDSLIDLGGITVRLVSGGKNRVDGGGMLGILPKVIWNRWYPADEKNRITLETHCLLVETGSRTVLVESGCGNKLNEKERSFYSVDENDWVGENLKRVGVEPGQVTQVLLTHLHTDHAGGVLMRSDSGDIVPTFPEAEVFVSKQELQIARSGRGITPNAYNRENYHSLMELGNLNPIASDAEIFPGVRFLATPGHTLGHVSVLIEGDRESLLFTGDLFPLAKQAIPHYNMAYDTDPVLKAETKQTILHEAFEKQWILVLSHEPANPVCRVVAEGGGKRYSLVSAFE